MRTVKAVKELHGWKAQVVDAPRADREPTRVLTLEGYFSTEEEAIAAAEARLVPTVGEESPSKHDLKGGKK